MLFCTQRSFLEVEKVLDVREEEVAEVQTEELPTAEIALDAVDTGGGDADEEENIMDTIGQGAYVRVCVCCPRE